MKSHIPPRMQGGQGDEKRGHVVFRRRANRDCIEDGGLRVLGGVAVLVVHGFRRVGGEKKGL
jgi:hypothetical protein